MAAQVWVLPPSLGIATHSQASEATRLGPHHGVVPESPTWRTRALGAEVSDVDPVLGWESSACAPGQVTASRGHPPAQAWGPKGRAQLQPWGTW